VGAGSPKSGENSLKFMSTHPPPLPWKLICSLLKSGSKPDGAMKQSLESGPITISISSYNNGVCT
jgi:hypothetical protein